MKSRLFMFGLVLLIVVCTFSWSTLRPQMVHAAPTASYNCGDTCVGKDPYTYYAGGQRCSDGAYVANAAYTQNDGTFTAQLQNLYSPKCNTNWALVWWTGGNSRIHGVRVNIYCPKTGQSRSEPVGEGLYNAQYSPAATDMIDGTYLTQAQTWLYLVQFQSPVFSTSKSVDA